MLCTLPFVHGTTALCNQLIQLRPNRRRQRDGSLFPITSYECQTVEPDLSSAARRQQGRPVLSIGFTVYCVSRILDILRVSKGKYRCKIGLKLRTSILIHGNLAFIADCNSYFGQNLYNIFNSSPKCIRFSPQITDNSLFSLFMTVKIANNIGFNLYGKYRLVLRR